MPRSAKPRKQTKATRAHSAWPPVPSRVKAIFEAFDRLYPAATCELHHENPFQLLCATILSAQCTDERVNKVAPALFAHFPTPAAMAKAEISVVEDLIRSTGFFHNKAKNLLGAARMLLQKWNGEMPRTMNGLLELPGVARKTANVVLSTAFGISEGVVVDTHVTRLSQRLGLTRSETPEKIEQDLMTIVPRERWILLAHQLIWHGRRVCQARKPNCDACPLAPFCPNAFHQA